MTTEHGLGRRYQPDQRNRNFMMRLTLDPLREQFFPRGLPDGSRHYWPGTLLDQLSTGTCVGHGFYSAIQGAPVMQKPPLSPYDFYRRFVMEDVWSDNNHEATAPDDQLQSGTSVLAGAKVCKDMGLLSAYLWGESAEDVRAWHLAGFGINVLGTLWTDDMSTPDSEGFASYTGRIMGGHCYVTTGWNDRVKHNGKRVRAVRCQNSWGKGWGNGGRFWLEMDDLEKLIADQGEACAPTEIKLAKRGVHGSN